ncbi:hypothetical protein LVV83_22140 [Pseudomonas sp. LM20]|uniref:hypothetical protein n=1 Tax=Pseudomonas sp. LM20 TaxID=2899116 RepID=UPI001F159EF3|nr:hypothetical protein [Pseudomonas sp. LM20]MCE5989728.1 hypothetical protein [Pseudomonas sp. LM20]
MIGVKIEGGSTFEMTGGTFTNMETAVLANDSTVILKNVRALGTKTVVKGTDVRISARNVFHDEHFINWNVTPLAIFIRMHAHGHV